MIVVGLISTGRQHASATDIGDYIASSSQDSLDPRAGEVGDFTLGSGPNMRCASGSIPAKLLEIFAHDRSAT